VPDLPNRADREAELAAALMLLFKDHSVSAGAVATAVQPALQKTYIDGSLNLLQATSADPHPAPSNEAMDVEAEKWAKSYAITLGKEIADSTRELLDGAADIDAVYGQPRAEMIAATEVTRAISAAEAWLVVFWAAEGFESHERRWHTEGDGHVCPICRPLNRAPESVWADRIPAGPPAHPNCRCWLDYQVP